MRFHSVAQHSWPPRGPFESGEAGRSSPAWRRFEAITVGRDLRLGAQGLVVSLLSAADDPILAGCASAAPSDVRQHTTAQR